MSRGYYPAMLMFIDLHYLKRPAAIYVYITWHESFDEGIT
jgi:hypothetical protein